MLRIVALSMLLAGCTALPPQKPRDLHTELAAFTKICQPVLGRASEASRILANAERMTRATTSGLEQEIDQAIAGKENTLATSRNMSKARKAELAFDLERLRERGEALRLQQFSSRAERNWIARLPRALAYARDTSKPYNMRLEASRVAWNGCLAIRQTLGLVQTSGR